MSAGNGNATNAETNSSQNRCGIQANLFAFFQIDSEISEKEAYLISLIKTSGKEKNYELIEYISDVNRTYAEVLVEQNCNGAMDTAYVYGTDRLSLDRFDGSTGYYLYDPKGSATGITNGEGQICLSYRYSAFGEITYGAPQYENIYAYNGESYNPNVGSLYLRARYYNVAAGAFFTEDSYLGNIREPLTLNRYVYCVGNPVNYVDPSGKSVENDIMKAVMSDSSIPAGEKGSAIDVRIRYYHALQTINYADATFDNVMSHDFDSDIFYGGVEGVFHDTLEALEARAELIRANSTYHNYLENAVESANENNAINYVDGNDINSNPYARFTMDDYEDLLAFAGEANNYDGFVAVAYVVLNRAIADDMTIEEVGQAKGFSAYNENYDINDVSEGAKQAAADVLMGVAENPIGDAYYFFGKITGYDLWVERNNCTYAKEVAGNVFYREWKSVHNMSSLTEEQRKSDDVIIIYDGENDKWLYHGEIIIDGEVVIHDGTAE